MIRTALTSRHMYSREILSRRLAVNKFFHSRWKLLKNCSRVSTFSAGCAFLRFYYFASAMKIIVRNVHSVRKREPPGNSLKLETSFFRQSSGQQTAELPLVSEETTYDRGAPSSRTFCNLSLQFREIKQKEWGEIFVCPIDLVSLIK